MTNFEACQLYIEQQVEAGLKDDKTPDAIGAELSGEIKKLFEAEISPATLKKRAQRLKAKLTNRDRCPAQKPKKISRLILNFNKELDMHFPKDWSSGVLTEDEFKTLREFCNNLTEDLISAEEYPRKAS